jgi:heat shock protein HslJ
MRIILKLSTTKGGVHMKTIIVALLTLAACVLPAGAQTLICFGNEPSWNITFSAPGVAQVTLPNGRTRDFRPRETRNESLRESVWRGRTSGGDLVLFTREAACSDGMSDVVHAMFARVSMPDGSFLVGCCRFPGGTDASATLEGRPWRLVNFKNSVTVDTHGLGLTLQFAAGQVSGFSGCNRFTGSYAVNGNRLTIKPGATTMMACPEPASTVESKYTRAIAGTHTYVITGDRLTMNSTSGSILAYQREPPPTLEGKTWKVTGYNNGREAVVSPIQGTELTVTFANGTASGSAGCNTFNAPYTQVGGRISIKTPATTRMMCPENIMVQEREFLKALESATRWNIDRDMLDMHRADGARALTATQAPIK